MRFKLINADGFQKLITLPNAPLRKFYEMRSPTRGDMYFMYQDLRRNSSVYVYKEVSMLERRQVNGNPTMIMRDQIPGGFTLHDETVIRVWNNINLNNVYQGVAGGTPVVSVTGQQDQHIPTSNPNPNVTSIRWEPIRF